MKWFGGAKENQELIRLLQKEQVNYQKLEVDYQDLLERFEVLQVSSLRSGTTSVDGIMTPDTVCSKHQYQRASLTKLAPDSAFVHERCRDC